MPVGSNTTANPHSRSALPNGEEKIRSSANPNRIYGRESVSSIKTSATRLKGMSTCESAYAVGRARRRHSTVEIVEVATLIRSENSTSSDAIASPK